MCRFQHCKVGEEVRRKGTEEAGGKKATEAVSCWWEAGGGQRQEGYKEREKTGRKWSPSTFGSWCSLYVRPGYGGRKETDVVCVCAFAKACGVCAALLRHSGHIWCSLHVACLANPVLAFGVFLCRLGKAENADTRS